MSANFSKRAKIIKKDNVENRNKSIQVSTVGRLTFSTLCFSKQNAQSNLPLYSTIHSLQKIFPHCLHLADAGRSWWLKQVCFSIII
jgi:hypothetical protein